MPPPPRYVDVVAVTFMDGYPENLLELAPIIEGTPLEARIMIEDGNIDPDAVGVFLGGRHVGYIPRPLNATLAASIRHGIRTRCEGFVRVHPEHPWQPGATIRIETLDPE